MVWANTYVRPSSGLSLCISSHRASFCVGVAGDLDFDHCFCVGVAGDLSLDLLFCTGVAGDLFLDLLWASLRRAPGNLFLSDWWATSQLSAIWGFCLLGGVARVDQDSA